jgi:hypothetical protein
MTSAEAVFAGLSAPVFEPNKLQAVNVNSMNTAKIGRMTNPEINLRNYTTRGARGLARKIAGKADTDAHPLTVDEQRAADSARHLIVPDDYAGLRLDQALVKFFPEYSRSRLQEWITGQQVRVDGKFATPKQKVWGGETLEVLPQIHPADQPYLAEDISLDIVYEDDTLLVINKRAAALRAAAGRGAARRHRAQAGQRHQRLAGGGQDHPRANGAGAPAGGTQRTAGIPGSGAW